MQAAGIVEHADRTERQYRVVNPKSVARLMTAYELATPDQVDTFIRVWGEFRLGPFSQDPDEVVRDPVDELLVRRGECIELVRFDVDLGDRGAVSAGQSDRRSGR